MLGRSKTAEKFKMIKISTFIISKKIIHQEKCYVLKYVRSMQKQMHECTHIYTSINLL